MTVAVIFGGRSCEHNISVITGVQAMGAVNKDYKLIPIYIDNNGTWWTGKEFNVISTFKSFAKSKKKRVHLRAGSNALYTDKGKKLCVLDVAILANHGLNGEDGSIQGLLQLCSIAYTCSDLRASAVGMDKIMMKQVFENHSLPVVPYTYFTLSEFSNSQKAVYEKIENLLKFPMIVKPSNLGSSIGISIAKNKKELKESIKVALEWDTRILIENALEGFLELNSAVLGRGQDLIASEIEQPIGWEGFLTFDDKYVKKNKGSGKGSARGSAKNFPANISEDLKEKVQDLAKKAFAAIGCSGVARVDFLLDGDNLYVNEINTIPGALSNYLFSYNDKIPFTKLIDKLIDIAKKDLQERENLKFSYISTFEIGGGIEK